MPKHRSHSALKPRPKQSVQPLRKQRPDHKRALAYLFLLINTITWGAALIVVKPALEHTSPFRYLLYRFTLAAILSLPIWWHYQKHPAIQKNLTKFVGEVGSIELLGTTLALGLLYMGLRMTTAIEAGLITTTTPIFIVLAGVFWLREQQKRAEWIGLTVAFLGTIIITLVPFIQNGSATAELSVLGNLLIILQNIATAAYFILAKRCYAQYPKLLIASLSFLVGVVTFLGLSFFELGWSLQSFATAVASDWSEQSVWIASGYMAVFGSIIGLTAYIKGQDMIEASEASIFTYLQPLVYIPLGITLLGETFSFWQGGGLLLILLGVWYAEVHG
ncbi:DMT family transporter, partial [Candidatus Woesebacteria bacterium]|nr:DMT family transporter [Candidatus Woesebacteria bacterium]